MLIRWSKSGCNQSRIVGGVARQNKHTNTGPWIIAGILGIADTVQLIQNVRCVYVCVCAHMCIRIVRNGNGKKKHEVCLCACMRKTLTKLTVYPTWTNMYLAQRSQSRLQNQNKFGLTSRIAVVLTSKKFFFPFFRATKSFNGCPAGQPPNKVSVKHWPHGVSTLFLTSKQKYTLKMHFTQMSSCLNLSF